MKKKISIVLCILLAAVFITACAADDSGSMRNMTAANDSYFWDVAEAPASAPMPESAMLFMEDALLIDMEMAEMDYGYFDGAHRIETAGSGITSISTPVVTGLAEKIIYSVSAEIETRIFDETIQEVYALMARHGAFIEHSSISGVNYASQFHNWDQFRSAYFSLRVPVNQLNAMTASLDSLGNVVHESSNAQNITSQFFDTQSRLNSLNIQEERLLDMLSKADDIPDLIAIEERLGEVRYQIEWLTTSLNNMQQQVDYSFLTLNIREVEQFTEITEPNRTYWQQIGDGFMSTIRGVGRFFMSLFMWLIVAAPVLIIIAVVAVAIFIIIRAKLRSMKKKKAETTAKTPQYNYAQYYPPQYTPQNPPQSNDAQEKAPPEN